jgi:hypothetical protein
MLQTVAIQVLLEEQQLLQLAAAVVELLIFGKDKMVVLVVVALVMQITVQVLEFLDKVMLEEFLVHLELMLAAAAVVLVESEPLEQLQQVETEGPGLRHQLLDRQRFMLVVAGGVDNLLPAVLGVQV